MNRKTFIRTSSVIGTFSLIKLPVFGFSSRGNSLPVIDTHQHLWDINRFGAAWSRPPLNRNFDQRDYLAATKGLNVVKAVYMEVGVPANMRHEEALYAIEMCRERGNPTAAAVIAADPNDPDLTTYLSQFYQSPYIKGIRYFFKSEEEILQPSVVYNIQRLSTLNMSFDFSVPTQWLPAMSRLIAQCPDTRFLVNHCGNVDPRAFFNRESLKGETPDHDRDQWIMDITQVADYPNVVCKISGVATRAMNHELTAQNLAPAINCCLDIFGPDRVMFASDWPVCLRKMKLDQWLNTLKEIVLNRSYTDQKKLFHDNAVQFYNI